MRLKTLGGLTLTGSDFSRGKPLLLLAYLALEGPQERRHLAELFWPTASDSLNSLSRALSQLRQGAAGALEADDARVWCLAPCNVHDFLEALAAHRPAEAVSLYGGPFLEGLFLNDWSAELEEWVYAQRERLALLAQGALLALAETEASQGRFAEAAKLGERAYTLKGASSPEPETLTRYHALFSAAQHPLAQAACAEATSYGVSLNLSPQEAQARLQASLIGRVRERGRLEGLAPGGWAWVQGGAGMGKTALLRSLSGAYLMGRSGLPYATLEPLLGATLGQGDEAMLRRLAGSEGTWLIDSWEWSDPESQLLLRRLRDLRSRARVVVASRERPLFRVDVELELGPLPEDALQRFPRAWERTEGIPSLVGAFLRGEALEGALETRLQALPEDAARSYLALALLERPDPALVRRALELDAKRMALALEALLQAGLIDPGGRVRAEQAVRYLLLDHPAQTGELALRLARLLEPLAAYGLYHRAKLFWEEADFPAIRESCLAFAAELLRRGAAQRASEVLDEAPPGDEVALLKARALEQTGHFREALDALAKVKDAPEVLALKAALYWRLGQPEAAREAAKNALEGDLEARAEAFNTLGHLARSEGNYEEASSLAKRAAALWKSLNISRWVDALNNVAVAMTYLGQPVEDAYQEALAAAGDNPVLQARVLHNIGWMHERLNQHDEAESVYQHVTQLATASNLADAAAWAWNNLGVLHHKLQRPEKAKAAYQQSLGFAQQTKDRRILGMVMANLAELTGDREAWEEALRILEQAGHKDEANAYREELPEAHPFRLSADRSA